MAGAENGLFKIATTGNNPQPVSIVNASGLAPIEAVAIDRPGNQLFFATTNQVKPGDATTDVGKLYAVTNLSAATANTTPTALTAASGVTLPNFGIIEGIAYDENAHVLDVSNDVLNSSGNYNNSELDELTLNGTVVTAVNKITYSSLKPGATADGEPFGSIADIPLSTLTIASSNAAAAKGAPTAPLSAAPTITDYGSGGFLKSASVTVADGATVGVSGDVLGIANGATFTTFTSTAASYVDNGHTFLVSYAGGVLTIGNQTGSGAAQENTTAAYGQVLQDVRYQTTSTDTDSRTVTYQVNNGAIGNPAGTLNTESVTVAVDKPPTIVAGGYKVPADVLAGTSACAAAPGALTGDTDPNGGTLTVTAVQGGSVGAAKAGTYGSLTLQSTGAYTYTASNTTAIANAATGSHPVDSYSFTVNNAGGTATETFAATIDRAPIAASTSATTLAGATSTTNSPGVLTGDSDPDGDTLTVGSVLGTPNDVGKAVAGTYGTLTINSNGSYTYAANNGLAIVTASGMPMEAVSYSVSDGSGGMTAAALTETVSLAAGGTETVTNPTGTAAFSLGATTLTINETSASTYSGVIGDGSSGFTGGNLVVSGTAPLTLAGASTYTGATTIAANATLDLSGGGSLAGSTGVADAGTFDVSAATAAETVKALTGAGTVNLGGTGLTITAASGTLSGVIAGTGRLTIAGGTQTLSGASTFSGGTTISGGTLQLGAANAAGTGAVTFAATSGTATASLALEAAAQPTAGMALAPGPAFGNTLANFNATTETLDLQGFTFNTLDVAYVTDGTSLTVMGGTGGAQTETFNLSNGALGYTAQADAAGTGTLITAVCYAGGTSIRVRRDGVDIDVAVEHLAVGDLAVIASGEHRPIRWLGSRVTHCRRHPRPNEVMPVRVSAHAFGDNRPARDLLVSPGHSLCVDVVGEVLIPAMALVNGTTITQEDVDRVTYWHIELEGGHAILLAENMPAESYLEMGNRGFFAESGVVALDASPDAPVATHADFCRPFHADGALVEVVRAQLAARAEKLGWRLEEQGLDDLHLMVDGVRIEPRVRGLDARFTVPADAEAVWFVSGSTVPADIGASLDHRVLGVCIAALAIADGFGAPRGIAIDDPRLCVGFYDVECGDDTSWRWTAGRARLPASLWEGLKVDTFLRVDLASPALPRWVGPAARDANVEPLRLVA